MLRIRCDRPEELLPILKTVVCKIEEELTNRLHTYKAGKITEEEATQAITSLGNRKSEVLEVIHQLRYWIPDVVYANSDILRYINMYEIDYPDDLIIREVVV